MEEIARLSQEDEDERRRNSAQIKSMLCCKRSCSSRTFAALLCCFTILFLIPGITCLTLGLLGYFSIDDPTMDLLSVTIKNIEMGYDGNVTGFIIGPMLNFLDMLTNDAASDIVPTQAIIIMEMVLLFNNTNTYNVRIEQGDMEGQIIIPGCAIDNDDDVCGNVNEMIIPNKTNNDIIIGTWNIPKIVLGSESSTEILISITLTIDLLHGNTKDLASLFIFGGRLLLLIEGDINVKSWIPGMHGQVHLQCLAELEEIQNFLDEKPNVKCHHSTNVSDWITVEGVIDPMMRRVLTTEEGDDDWTTKKRSVLEMTQSTNNTRYLNVSTTQQTTEYEITYKFCDENALPAESTSVSDLTHNKFYKICPGTHGNNPVSGMPIPLGQPRCGDGSNYSFLFSRPMETNNATMKRTGEKILIELAGGGACWDNITCQIQSFALKIPGYIVDPLVGTACSDANDAFGSLLCDRSIGSVNFSDYNFAFLPYCTQDVHMGDKASAYGIRHVGAHNLYRTLRWIFDNFPEPSAFVITGCSAGATPLMVVYDLINSHYNKGAFDDEDGHQVRLIVIEDSPVFLTPPYYLRNYLPNWNVGTIFDLVDFDFELYKLDETFPDAVREHVIRRGKVSDEFALVTHNADEISLFYYEMMCGSFNMSNPSIPDADSTAEWWSKMNGSIDHAKQSHSNFDAFVMKGSAHCTFSLVRYYSLPCPLLSNTQL